MDYIHPSKIGELLRKRRKELGLRLEDLADEFVSPSTISNIERGITYVNEEKVRYVADKLGVELDRIHELLEKEKQEEEQLELRLSAVESMIDLVGPDKGLERLRKLNIQGNHALACVAHFLRGKIYLAKKNWVKAQNHFLEAIRIVDQKPERLHTNIKAASYQELGKIALMFHKDPGQALRYVDEGLEAFQEDGDRAHCRYTLLISRINYLEMLDRIEEALHQIHDLWNEMERIDNVETVLELYGTRVRILDRLKLHEEAVRYAVRGIELARVNRKMEQACGLWMMLGRVYISREKWGEAEHCFQTALGIQEKLRSDRIKAEIFTRLGQIRLRRGELEDARSMLSRAAEAVEGTPISGEFGEIWLLLGDTYRFENRFDEAEKLYLKALEVSEDARKEERRNILLRLAVCQERTDPEKFSDTLRKIYHIDLESEVSGDELPA
ncbi:helix-turn-helix domain-containing protein [Staphylospora marina]|uniref:helix-turn-helix domain-containing protein n=1 Tax=Staphylospora marina TaxID=2490858 RepID=UPI0013DE7489|nr:tetratricopeptide repeat protein [Staphylospora marina]